MESLNMLIDGTEDMSDLHWDTMMETNRAMYKVLRIWRDMSRIGQSVKFSFDDFESAIAKSMWNEPK